MLVIGAFDSLLYLFSVTAMLVCLCVGLCLFISLSVCLCC